MFTATPLQTFLTDAYAGRYGTNPDSILSFINQHFPSQLNIAIGNALAEQLQLQFLHTCVSQRHLQNTCSRHDCSALQLNTRHRIIDHLIELFFKWIEVKYRHLGFIPDPISAQQYGRMSKVLGFLADTVPAESLNQSITLDSMVATLIPFITNLYGVHVYDICGNDSHFYLPLHSHDTHPYVRLGGVLKRKNFCLNCSYFDMRGVDFSDTCFYGADYAEIKRDLFLLPETRNTQLNATHANFAHADLRFANLRRVRSDFPGAFDNTRLDHASLTGSNINTPMLHNDGHSAGRDSNYCILM
ncbi:MAG: hypothetical protein K5Q00_04360 [Gammaproteobacteria bacterium]|nr:hypothetical protein [Gammaproteobacteria bacterium]